MPQDHKIRLSRKAEKDSVPPIRMSGTERRRQILETAIIVFSEKGFSGATTKEIAHRAKINESLIFRHFNGKGALYEAILNELSREERYVTSWNTLVEFAAVKNDSEVFTTAGKLIIERNTSERDFLRVLIYGILENRGSVARMLAEKMRPLEDFLVEYIEIRQSDRAFRRTEPLPVVNAFIGMTMHHLMTGEMFCRPNYKTTDGEAIAVFARIIMADLQYRSYERANLEAAANFNEI